jgi:hypothetical protein
MIFHLVRRECKPSCSEILYASQNRTPSICNNRLQLLPDVMSVGPQTENCTPIGTNLEI